MKSTNKTKYEGLSLIEMIITLLIVGMVLVVTSSTLAALIKASAIASAKTMSRSETEFILELLEKSIMNSQSEQIVMLSTERFLTSEGEIIGNTNVTEVPFGGAQFANEIHYRPVRTSEWVCIGFVKGGDGTDFQGQGFIVKGYSDVQNNNCLMNGPVVILSADEIDIQEFDIYGYTTSLGNYTFIIDMTVKPIYWIPGRQSVIQPEYTRQLIVSTRRLIY